VTILILELMQLEAHRQCESAIGIGREFPVFLAESYNVTLKHGRTGNRSRTHYVSVLNFERDADLTGDMHGQRLRRIWRVRTAN
jgi:hypothetical protein